MARDIEEFLRKAVERRNKSTGQAQPPQAVKSQEQPRTRTLVPEVVDASEVEIVGGDAIANRNFDTSRIAHHIAQLGSEVRSADDKIETRLKETFDHDVERLKKRSHDHSTSSTGGSDLLKLLRNPKSIRQAIIIAEILKRPEF
jgi:hypothetical protein